ncbi:putative Hsp40 co-chaperone Jid1 [Metarhizium anisopliae]
MFTARTFHRASHVYHGSRSSNTRRRHSLSSLRQPGLPEWPASSAPTPHEILGVAPGAPYSKDRFNQLVKMYHPDMSGADARVRHLPQSVRLERYRLIVAAHNLLSDPSNRRLYESHRQGWVYPRPFTGRQGDNRHGFSSKDGAAQNPPSPMRQRPIYASNATVAILLVALGMLGAALQFKRLAASRRDIRRLELVLQEAIQEEIQAWASVLQGQTKDDRILAFLARRHGVPHQLQSWAASHGKQ